MNIQINHSGGVGSNSKYAILTDGVLRGKIAYWNSAWRVFDLYDWPVGGKHESKDAAAAWAQENAAQIPNPSDAYQAAWDRTYQNRRRQAIAHLAQRMAVCLEGITNAAEKASYIYEAGTITRLIESAARGETDLPYNTKGEQRDFSHVAVVGFFPKPPQEKAA